MHVHCPTSTHHQTTCLVSKVIFLSICSHFIHRSYINLRQLWGYVCLYEAIYLFGYRHPLCSQMRCWSRRSQLQWGTPEKLYLQLHKSQQQQLHQHLPRSQDPELNEWSLAMSCSDDAFSRILIQNYLWTPSAPGFNEDVDKISNWEMHRSAESWSKGWRRCWW